MLKKKFWIQISILQIFYKLMCILECVKIFQTKRGLYLFVMHQLIEMDLRKTLFIIVIILNKMY